MLNGKVRGMDIDTEQSFIISKFNRKRGKCNIFLQQKDFFPKLVMSSSTKCIEPPAMELQSYKTISNDIWFHVAKHIPPEAVQTFALICRQTAALVRSKCFWRLLYKNYCQSNQWTKRLPEELHNESLRFCDKHLYRLRVIEALFHCYPPLKQIVQRTYPLDFLLGQRVVASWHNSYRCSYIMYYKFCRSVTLAPEGDSFPVAVPDDWESLATSTPHGETRPTKPDPANTGFNILLVLSKKFVPFPPDFLRLVSTRELLVKDLCGCSLELNFSESFDRGNITTIKYPEVTRFKVVPWWHPEMSKINRASHKHLSVDL